MARFSKSEEQKRAFLFSPREAATGSAAKINTQSCCPPVGERDRRASRLHLLGWLLTSGEGRECLKKCMKAGFHMGVSEQNKSNLQSPLCSAMAVLRITT